MPTVASLITRGQRETLAEKAALEWISAKEHLFETGLASAPLCGYRELENGREDFLTSIVPPPDKLGSVIETYSSGTRIEYEYNLNFGNLETREKLFRKGNFRVTFPDGGVLVREGKVTRYTSQSGAVGRLKVATGRTSLANLGKANRIFAKAEQVVAFSSERRPRQVTFEGHGGHEGAQFKEILSRGICPENARANLPRPRFL